MLFQNELTGEDSDASTDNEVSVNWEVEDPESGLDYCEWAIGELSGLDYCEWAIGELSGLDYCEWAIGELSGLDWTTVNGP